MNIKRNYSGDVYEINGRAVIGNKAAQAGDPGLCDGEVIRYPQRDRFAANNGFRRRQFEIGRRHAAAINAARRGDEAAVLAHIATLGGVLQPRSILRSALRIASRLPADVLAYHIENRRVLMPRLSWRFSGRRQVAQIEWWPM